MEISSLISQVMGNVRFGEVFKIYWQFVAHKRLIMYIGWQSKHQEQQGKLIQMSNQQDLRLLLASNRKSQKYQRVIPICYQQAGSFFLIPYKYHYITIVIISSNIELFGNARGSMANILAADAAFQFYLLNNATLAMINQLLQSSQKQRRRKKGDQRVNLPHKPHHRNQTLSLLKQQQQVPFQQQMSIKVVNFTPQRHYMPHDDIEDIQHTIRSKLQRKKVYLPKIYENQSSNFEFRSLSPQPHSYGVSRINLAKSTTKNRLRTQHYDLPSEQDQDKLCESTLVQISELNRRFEKQIRREDERSQKVSQFFRHDEKYQTRSRFKFNHPSRQDEFDQYVNYLQRSCLRKLKNYGRQSRLDNPQPYQNYSHVKHTLENPEEKTYRRDHSRNASKTINPTQTANRPDYKDMQKNSKLIKRRELNDQFINILRKVKNRGESLLIKLNKYPSNKNVGK